MSWCIKVNSPLLKVLTSYLSVSRDQFDSPSITTLGANMVIPGLEEGLSGMCVGERREVVAPPHWGHGENGGQYELQSKHTFLFTPTHISSALFLFPSWWCSRERRALLRAGAAEAAERYSGRLHVCVAGGEPRPPLFCHGSQWWQRGPSRGGKSNCIYPAWIYTVNMF